MSESNEIEVIGDGTVENSYTSVLDVARYVAHVFTCASVHPVSLLVYGANARSFPAVLPAAPDSAILNKALYLSGTRAALLPVAQKLQAATPGSKIVHVDDATARERWATKYDFVSWLLAELDQGSNAWKEEDVAFSRSLFPDWNPKGLN